MGRQKSNIHYIYKITCLVTGRYYIGMHSTSNLDDGYMGSGKRLRYSIRKHGIDNHKKEIIEFFESRELLVEAEIKSITPEMIQDNNCMNLKCGGQGGFVNKEHQKKASNSGTKNYLKKLENDLVFRNEFIEKCRNVFKGYHKIGKLNSSTRFKNKTHSDETKQLMSESSKGMGIGESNSQYGTCWITKDGLNKKIKKEDLDKYQLEGWVKGRK